MTPHEQFKEAIKSAFEFRAANKSLVDQITKSLGPLKNLRLSEILPDLQKDFAHINTMQAELAKARSVIDSPMFKLSQEASLSAARRMAEQMRTAQRFTKPLSEIMASQARPLSQAMAAMSEIAMQSHFAKLSEITLLSQRMLADIQIKDIASTFKVEDSTRNYFKEIHFDFAKQYANLFRSQESELSSVVRDLTYLPSIEFYRGAQIVRTTSSPSDEPSAEEEQISLDLGAETTNAVEKALERINPELIRLWRGAIASIEDSKNPDSVRHCTTSLRELLTQVMHALSPDVQIKAWSNLPAHFDKGRPTRRARLLYISRDINHEPFSAFLEKDIESVLATFDMFHEGTHKVAPPFSQPQLIALKLRTESAVRFVIDISKPPNE